ncbi:Uncharacterised protein [Pasteurella multocida subsp. septica]|nr:Uncharacterised protein [Pasteurella multocida subsp. septica]
MCYSHSRYYAEVPDKTMIDSHGNVIENPAYKDFAEKWGKWISKILLILHYLSWLDLQIVMGVF